MLRLNKNKKVEQITMAT